MDLRTFKVYEYAIDSAATGKRIAKLMKDYNVKNGALADSLGVTEQTICKWRKGQSIPSIDNLVFLSVLFRLPMDEILIIDKTVTDITDSEQERSVMKAVQNMQGLVVSGKEQDSGTDAADESKCAKDVIFYIWKNDKRNNREV